MKRVFLLAVLLLLTAESYAGKKPDKVSREDMLDLENVALKIDALQRQADSLIAHRIDVLKKYDLSPEDIGKTAKVATDGTIQRMEPKK